MKQTEPNINRHLNQISYKLKKKLVKIWHKPTQNVSKFESNIKKSVAELTKEYFDAGHF